MYKFYICFSLFLLLVACSPKKHDFSVSEIPGIYFLNIKGAQNILVVKSDGNYLNKYYVGGKQKINSGLWTVVEGKEIVLRFLGFESLSNKSNTDKEDWIVQPEKTSRISLFGGEDTLHMRLCFNYDLDYCFVKTGN